MDAFEIYKFLHISAAIVWVGGGFFSLIFTHRARSADPAHRLGIARDMHFVGNRVFGPAAMATLLFGILMVVDFDGYTFSQTWIIIGLSAIGASIVLGALLIGRQSALLLQELEAGDPGASRRLQVLTRLSYVDMTILLIAVWAMVAKPL